MLQGPLRCIELISSSISAYAHHTCTGLSSLREDYTCLITSCGRNIGSGLQAHGLRHQTGYKGSYHLGPGGGMSIMIPMLTERRLSILKCF